MSWSVYKMASENWKKKNLVRSWDVHLLFITLTTTISWKVAEAIKCQNAEFEINSFPVVNEGLNDQSRKAVCNLEMRALWKQKEKLFF